MPVISAETASRTRCSSRSRGSPSTTSVVSKTPSPRSTPRSSGPQQRLLGIEQGSVQQRHQRRGVVRHGAHGRDPARPHRAAQLRATDQSLRNLIRDTAWSGPLVITSVARPLVGRMFSHQVRLVDRGPDPVGGFHRLAVGQLGIPAEIRAGMRRTRSPASGGIARRTSGGHRPGARRHRSRSRRSPTSASALRPALVQAGRLQHVEPLDDQHVRPADDDLVAGEDVVGQVVVPGGPHLGRPRLHLGDEPEQRPPVVGLRETLALHQVPLLQDRVRIEEPVGGDQLDPGRVRPAGQHLRAAPGRSSTSRPRPSRRPR